MRQLRASLPQGGTIDKRSKEDQAKLKRMESSVAYPTSDADTGITETPGDLGETAYPQSDRMDAEEALLNKLAVATKGNETKTKPNVVGSINRKLKLPTRKLNVITTLPIQVRKLTDHMDLHRLGWIVLMITKVNKKTSITP